VQNFRIIAVGKLREKYLAAGVAEYLKRLGGLARVEMVEVGDEPLPEPLSPAMAEMAMAREGERLLSKTRPQAYCVALAIHGKSLGSEEFAALLADLGLKGHSQVDFIIGGTLGLSPAVLNRANLLLSLSTMTLPHQLARLVLAEQLYRACKINRGEKYHK